MKAKRIKGFCLIAVLAISAAALTACGGSTASTVQYSGQASQEQQDNSGSSAQPAITYPVYSSSDDVRTQSSAQTQQSSVLSGAVSGKVTLETDWGGIEEMPPCVYYWSDTDTEMVKWPGDKLTKNGSTFSFTVPAGAEYIIFNDAAAAQTIDIPFDGSVTDYVVKDEINSLGKYLVTDGSGNSISEKKAYSSTSEISSSQMELTVESAYTVPEAYKNNGKYSTGGGTDALSFKIKNSGSGKATNIKLYVICFDKNGNTVHPSTGSMDNWSLDYKTDLLVLNTSADGVSAYTTDTINYECGLNGAERCEAVIAEYALNGVLYKNTDAAAWANRYITAK